MNEKLYELLAMVQRTAVQVSDVAVDAAYATGKKAEELVGVAKLNIRMMERKGDIKTALKEVGELLYATQTGNPTSSEILQAKLEEIDRLKAEVAELEQQLGREKAGSVCTTCGAAVNERDTFCRECGDKL